MVDKLVSDQGHKIAKHDLSHGAQSAQRHAVGDADNRRLGDGGGQHTFGELGGQSACDLERAAVRVKDIFAQHKDTLIGLHGVVQGGVEGFENCGHKTLYR